MKYGDWVKELQAEHRTHDEYRKRARDVKKRYRLEEERGTSFNVLWANTEILQAALYSKTPQPDVRRRFKDENKVARDAAEMIERALDFSMDSYDFDGAVEPAVNDYLVPALGQVRVNYDVSFAETKNDIPVRQESDGENIRYLDDDGNVQENVTERNGEFVAQVPAEEIAFQEVTCSTVPWDRFRWSPAKDWESVWWVGEDHFLEEEEVRDTFDIKADEVIPLSYDNVGNEVKKGAKEAKTAKVTEVWDARTRKHFALIQGMDRILKFTAGNETADDDPLKLKQFWPYPKPLFANCHSGKVIPIPDYCFYQDQAEEMDELSVRIEKLTRQLRYRGVYDGSFKQLQDIIDAIDGTFIPVENFAARFGERGQGLDSVMASLPLEELKMVIAWLIEAREQVKQTIFELTGISDIVRGSTKASETLGAQQLKGQFANMRLSKRQRGVQHFVRDILRIKAEIIAEHFEPDVLMLMTGKDVTPEMMQILKSDVLREFNISIETDSTILADQTEEQAQRAEVTRVVTELVSAWAPFIQAAPGVLEIVQELVKFNLAAFKSGRNLEDVFDRLSGGTASDVDTLVGVPGGGGPASGDNVSPIPGQPAVGGGGIL